MIKSIREVLLIFNNIPEFYHTCVRVAIICGCLTSKI